MPECFKLNCTWRKICAFICHIGGIILQSINSTQSSTDGGYGLVDPLLIPLVGEILLSHGLQLLHLCVIGEANLAFPKSWVEPDVLGVFVLASQVECSHVAGEILGLGVGVG